MSTKQDGDPKGVGLEVAFDRGPYLVGEPIFVQCSLVNRSSGRITIPYYHYASESAFIWSITAADGSRVHRLEYERDHLGPKPLTLGPGARHTQTYNLYDEYAISKADRYELNLNFESDGKHYSWDAEAQKAVEDRGWSGSLSISLGELEILNPTQPADAEAFRKITPTGDLVPRSGPVQFPFIYAVRAEANRRFLIERLPESRYTAYARYYQALDDLDRFERTKHAPFARPAVEHLGSIDRPSFPKLFQEEVLYHLIRAHVAANSPRGRMVPLIKEFKEKFPDSPYVVPRLRAAKPRG